MENSIVVQVIASVGVVLAAIITVCLPKIFEWFRETKKQLEANRILLKENQEILYNLITYKPGLIAYNLLKSIKNNDGNIYKDDDDNQKRCLNLLLDDGYLTPAPNVKSIEFIRENSGKRLNEIANLSPIGEQLITLREGKGTKIR